LFLIELWEIGVVDRHVVYVKLIADYRIGFLSLVEGVPDAGDVLAGVFGVEADVDSVEEVFLFVLFPENLEFLVFSLVVQNFNWFK